LTSVTETSPPVLDSKFRVLPLCCDIGGHADSSLNDAAKATGITSGSASLLVDALCSLEILLKTRNPADRRRIRLSVTAKTERFLDEIETFLLRRGEFFGKDCDQWP